MPISTTSSSLNSASANAGRQSALLQSARSQEDAAAAQLRAQLASNGNVLAPGTKVTARIQYTVDKDGKLNQTSSEITHEVSGDEKQGGSRQFLQQQQQAPSDQTLASLERPHPLLSPSDEVALFADQSSQSTATNATTENTSTLSISQGEGVAEDGSSVDVEIIAPQIAQDHTDSAQLLVLPQLQAQVASLYARNNDIVFSATPLTELAA